MQNALSIVLYALIGAAFLVLLLMLASLTARVNRVTEAVYGALEPPAPPPPQHLVRAYALTCIEVAAADASAAFSAALPDWRVPTTVFSPGAAAGGARASQTPVTAANAVLLLATKNAHADRLAQDVAARRVRYALLNFATYEIHLLSAQSNKTQYDKLAPELRRRVPLPAAADAHLLVLRLLGAEEGLTPSAAQTLHATLATGTVRGYRLLAF
jgi:hypothetical protein